MWSFRPWLFINDLHNELLATAPDQIAKPASDNGNSKVGIRTRFQNIPADSLDVISDVLRDYFEECWVHRHLCNAYLFVQTEVVKCFPRGATLILSEVELALLQLRVLLQFNHIVVLRTVEIEPHHHTNTRYHRHV